MLQLVVPEARRLPLEEWHFVVVPDFRPSAKGLPVQLRGDARRVDASRARVRLLVKEAQADGDD